MIGALSNAELPMPLAVSASASEGKKADERTIMLPSEHKSMSVAVSARQSNPAVIVEWFEPRSNPAAVSEPCQLFLDLPAPSSDISCAMSNNLKQHQSGSISLHIPRSHHSSFATSPDLPRMHTIFVLLLQPSHPPDFIKFFLDNH
jgi:hypothetical protein